MCPEWISSIIPCPRPPSDIIGRNFHRPKVYLEAILLELFPPVHGDQEDPLKGVELPELVDVAVDVGGH